MAPTVTRKKKVVAVVTVILSLLLAHNTLHKQKRLRNCWVRPWIARRGKYGAHNALLCEVRKEDPKAFRNFLRMDYGSFQELLEKVKPLIKRKATNMREPISAEERLSVTLRYLASGNKYQDLEYLYRIPISTLSSIIPETCKAVYEVLKNEYLKVPQTEDEWRKIANGFEHTWNFLNCIGALDGKHIKIKPPKKSGSFYYNYKHNFSIVLLALVDADYKFTYVDEGCQGRVSDGGVFRESSLRKAMDMEHLNIPPPQPLPGGNTPMPFVIVADDAFPLNKNIMKPFPQRGLDLPKRVFNYRLSRARRIVENAFGILSNRFCIYETAFPLDPEKVEWIVLATCVLHNFLRTKSASRVLYTPTDSLDRENRVTHRVIKGTWRLQQTPAGIASIVRQGGNRSARNAKDVQEEFKHYFNHDGQVSWQWRLA